VFQTLHVSNFDINVFFWQCKQVEVRRLMHKTVWWTGLQVRHGFSGEIACPFFPFWRAAAFYIDWRMLLSRPSFSPIYVESYVKSLVVLARARQTPRVPFFIMNWFSESRLSKAINSVCSELIAALKLRECVGSVIGLVLSPHNGRGQQLLVRCYFCSVRLLACKLQTGSPTGDPVQLFP
jgi:hypothetical protein